MVISKMTAVDMEMALAWAKAENWNPGRGDAPLYRGLDPDGFLIGRVDDEPVAIVSIPVYDESYAFIGFYIVPPEHRGRGYGHAIWSAAIKQAGSRTIGLDAILAQVPNYRRSGFTTVHHNVRFAGPIDIARTADARIGAVDGDLDALVAFDARHLPARRDTLARAWVTAPGHHVRIARLGGRIVGYGVARPAADGHRIGPLYAETSDIADALLVVLAASCGPDQTMVLDVPEPNAAAFALAARHGLRSVLETARMYKGSAPALPLDEIYALTSTEIG